MSDNTALLNSPSTPQNGNNGKREFLNLLEILTSDRHWVAHCPNPLSLGFVQKFCAEFNGHSKSEFRHQLVEVIKNQNDGMFIDIPPCITNSIWKFREEIINVQS